MASTPFRPLADNDVVIVSALRTPQCKATRGALKDVYCDHMLATVFRALFAETGIDPSLVGDICVGNVLQSGSGAMTSRLGQLYARIPYTVPMSTTNRFCASGLQAIVTVGNAIRSGQIECGIGAGVESCSMYDMGDPGPLNLNPARSFETQITRDCMLPMGITSENVAERYGVTRAKQDTFAMHSQLRAAAARDSGRFDAEIAPVTTDSGDTVRADDGIRGDTSLAGLSKLKPAFKPGGTTTAGNSSQKSDGAAACLVTSASFARRHRLPVLGVLRSFAAVGVEPSVMGIGPAEAIPKALKLAGIGVSDVDVFEINEAFASQCVYCMEKLGIDHNNLNPNGGAIALGHPLGCSGARMTATLLHELRRRGKRSYGVVSMCIGTGMGAAAVFEYPGLPESKL